MTNTPQFFVAAGQGSAAVVALGPRHAHDCQCCQMLGRADAAVAGTPQDVYYCPGPGTLIVRYSSQGPEYQSFPEDVARHVDRGVWPPAVALLDAWRAAGSHPDWRGFVLPAG